MAYTPATILEMSRTRRVIDACPLPSCDQIWRISLGNGELYHVLFQTGSLA